MEKNNIFPLETKNNEKYQVLNEDFTTSSSTISKNSIINTANTYFYANYKTPKKDITTIQKIKNSNISTNNLNIPIYSKGKIKYKKKIL